VRELHGTSPSADDRARALNDPLVSIILPTYNGSRYLDASIGSCLNQSYSNIELIVVDDCSTDATPEIIRERAARDARIRIVAHERNRKLPGSLNSGFSRARGEYLSWTSDDNLYQPYAIERMVSALRDRPDAAVVYAGYAVIGDTGQVLNTEPARQPSNLVLGNVVGACFLYRREVQDAVGPYDETLFLAEDYDFWLRAAQRFQFVALDTELYFYRQHQQSLSASRCIEFSSAYCKAVTKSLGYFEATEPEYKGRFHFKHGVHLFAAGQIAEARDSLRRSVEEYKTLETWPGFVVNQLIYTHGGELRDELSLLSLLDLVPGLDGRARSTIVSWLHVVACFKAHRERSPSQVRFHFAQAVRHNPACLGNRGLLKAVAQACIGRTDR
jgi:glycosyltransferase involved in cell wall biosynthesis